MPPGYPFSPVPLKKPSRPTKLPSSPWLPGFLKSCHLLISTKLNAKISRAINVSVRRARAHVSVHPSY